MPLVDAVILDLGNVLVFHDNAYLFRRLGERGGLSGEQVAASFTRAFWDAVHRGQIGPEALRARVAAELGVPLDAGTFFELWSCHFRVHREVLPLVESLVGRVKLLLLSNTNALHFDWVRPRLPVLERFDHLLVSHELGLAKPDAALFQLALERAQVPAPRAAFFDDLPEYVQAASGLGLRGHLFTDAATFARQLAELGL